MNWSTIIALLSGALQVAVAAWALRICRRFGTAHVGWRLVIAFSMLAAVHLIFSVNPFRDEIPLAMKGDVTCALISCLLLLSLAHSETQWKERDRAKRAEGQALAAAEARVTGLIAELTAANEELKQTAARLEAEVAERKEMQEQAEITHKEMLVVSRQAGMSEVATGVLHSVGNVLNSVNVSATVVAEHVDGLKIANFIRAVSLMRDHAADLGDYLTRDSKGRQLPDYFQQLASHLSKEQVVLAKEMQFVKTKIEHIKEIIATQQNYGKVVGLAEKLSVVDLVEDVLCIRAAELSQDEVRVERDYEPRLPEIVVDKHKVLLILLNLLTNAQHACVESGRPEKQVTVRVHNGDEFVRVAISDNGLGIPEANLKQIFNYGFTTRKKNGGHGFGLHSGALAAKEMGGALVAQSDGPGRGATFTLKIPANNVSTAFKS